MLSPPLHIDSQSFLVLKNLFFEFLVAKQYNAGLALLLRLTFEKLEVSLYFYILTHQLPLVQEQRSHGFISISWFGTMTSS